MPGEERTVASLSKVRIAAVVLLAAAVLVACGDGGDSSTRQHPEVDSDGVPLRTVELPKTSPLDTLDLEVLTVVGADSSPEHLISRIWHPIVEGPAFTAAVLDSRARSIRVFDTQGELVGHLGRRGEGPGEYTQLGGVAYRQGLGWIVIAEYPDRLLLFDENLAFGESKPASDLLQRYGGLHPLWHGPLFAQGLDQFWLISFTPALHKPPDPEGEYSDMTVSLVDWTTLESTVVQQFQQPTVVIRRFPERPSSRSGYWEGPSAAFDTDIEGNLWINAVDPYVIEIIAATGQSRWRLRADFELRPYSAETRNEIEAMRLQMGGRGSQLKAPSHMNAIQSIVGTPSGQMWVFHPSGREKYTRVDLFKKEGAYVQSFLAPHEMWDALIGQDMIWAKRTAEDGGPELVLYRYGIPNRNGT